MTRALAMAAALAVAGSSSACGDRCQQHVKTATFGLRDDELDAPCEDVCAETIDDGSIFEGCSRSAPEIDPPTITCTFSFETCKGGGGF